MSDFLLRPAAAADAPDIIDIWCRSFGDSPEFAAALLDGAGLLPCAICAEADGRVKSVMFAFEGLSLGGRPAAYLYALCTDPDERGRGMGRAVVRALTERCFARGAELVFFLPADSGLAAWYDRTFGAKPFFGYADVVQPVQKRCARCTPVSPAEFADARRGNVGVTPQLLTAQSIVHRFYGGGFFRIDLPGSPAYACAEVNGDAVLIRELFCPEASAAEVCGALAEYFDADRVLRRTVCGSSGQLVYIIYKQENEKSLEIPAFFYFLE